MRYLYLLILWLPVQGQPSLFLPSTGTWSTGNAGHAFFHNPASLALAKEKSLRIAGGKSFMLVPAFSMAATLPVGASSFGFVGDYSGDAILRDLRGGIAYGRKLAEKVNVGLLFNYQVQQVPGHASRQAAVADAGVMLQATSELITGIRVSKPVFRQENHWPGTSFHADLGYRISDRFGIAASASKMQSRPTSLQMAADYAFTERMSSSLGYQSGTSSWFFGAAIGFPGFRLHLLTHVHPYLGVTPVLSIFFHKKNKDNELDR